MKHDIRLLSGAGLALVAIIGLGLQASPAYADCTDACTSPILPKGPESVVRSWDAQGLAKFLKSEIQIEYKDREGRPIEVIPQYEVWTKESGKPVATHSGRAIAFEKPGRQGITNGVFDTLPRDLQRHLSDDQFMVTSVRTLDGDERFSWSDRNASAALVLQGVSRSGSAEREKGNDQMVMFFAIIRKIGG